MFRHDLREGEDGGVESSAMEDGVLDPPSVTDAERDQDSTSMQAKCNKCGEVTSKRRKPKDKTKKSTTAHIAAAFHHMTSTIARTSSNQV